MKPLLLVLFTLTLLTACTKSTKKMIKTVEKSETIQLFVIDQFATELTEQNANDNYIMDYKIFNQIPLTDSQQVEIKTFVSNQENYAKDLARTCPFVGKYALSFTQNGKVTSMVIGSENCPKAMILGKEVEDRVILDFVDVALVKLLEGFVNK